MSHFGDFIVLFGWRFLALGSELGLLGQRRFSFLFVGVREIAFLQNVFFGKTVRFQKRVWGERELKGTYWASVGHSFGQVRAADGTKPQEFKKMADAIEARVSSTWACRSASRDARNISVKLFWAKPGGYKSVFSFVSTVLQHVTTARWRLDCLEGVPQERPPATTQSGTIPAGTAASSLAQLAVKPNQQAENAAVEQFKAEQELLEASLAEAAAGDSVGTGVFRSVETAGMVFDRSPCFSWLLCKALEAERFADSAYNPCPQAAAAMELSLGDVVGEGSFAKVKQGVMKHTGQRVAAKILKDVFDEPLDFLREVSICSSLVHPNIVRLLDVFIQPDRTLVFAWAGPTLYEACRKNVVSKANWQAVALQLLAGTAYFHAKFVAHTDLKPKNMCWEDGRLTILDFGQAIITIPGFRACYDAKQIEKKGLPYGTLNYRSPEVLLGDVAWERPMDIWAAGLVVAEVWSSQNKRPFLVVQSAVDALMLIFAILAAPMLPRCLTSRSSRFTASSFR